MKKVCIRGFWITKNDIWKEKMAKRPAWTIKNGTVDCDEFGFDWNGGFALSQKQKNINHLHQEINERTRESALEISSKSPEAIGRQLSAFSLKVSGYYLENVFQAAKKYENGGPYTDILNAAPKDAKRDERHRTSGNLLCFVNEEIEWPLEPKTVFYDYLYVSAVVENYGTDLDLSEYSWFTDIEFNPKRSINCQARAITIYKLIQKNNMFDIVNSKDMWIAFHQKNVRG